MWENNPKLQYIFQKVRDDKDLKISKEIVDDIDFIHIKKSRANQLKTFKKYVEPRTGGIFQYLSNKALSYHLKKTVYHQCYQIKCAYHPDAYKLDILASEYYPWIHDMNLHIVDSYHKSENSPKTKCYSHTILSMEVADNDLVKQNLAYFIKSYKYKSANNKIYQQLKKLQSNKVLFERTPYRVKQRVTVQRKLNYLTFLITQPVTPKKSKIFLSLFKTLMKLDIAMKNKSETMEAGELVMYPMTYIKENSFTRHEVISLLCDSKSYPLVSYEKQKLALFGAIDLASVLKKYPLLQWYDYKHQVLWPELKVDRYSMRRMNQYPIKLAMSYKMMSYNTVSNNMFVIDFVKSESVIARATASGNLRQNNRGASLSQQAHFNRICKQQIEADKKWLSRPDAYYYEPTISKNGFTFKNKSLIVSKKRWEDNKIQLLNKHSSFYDYSPC
jgi:uncharacterized protein (DUF2147 family)